MNKAKELFAKYKEVIMYLVFGALTTIVSWGTYALFVRGIGINISVGNALSWICAVTFAFFTNKFFVFRSKEIKPSVFFKELVSFFSARIVTGAIEIVGVPLLVKLGLNQTIFGTEGMLSKIIVSVLVVILNYVFSKLIVFRKK